MRSQSASVCSESPDGNGNVGEARPAAVCVAIREADQVRRQLDGGPAGQAEKGPTAITPDRPDRVVDAEEI